MDNGDQFFRLKYQGFLTSELPLTKNLTCLYRYQWQSVLFQCMLISP